MPIITPVLPYSATGYKIGNKNGTALINVSRGISFAGDMTKNRIRLEAKKYIEKMRFILDG